MAIKVQLRRGTAAQWTSANPVLADGEAGVERDTGLLKIGDGATAWNYLAYANRCPPFTSSTRPAASVAWEGRTIYVKDPGSAGEYHGCRQAADGSYEWIVVAY